LREQRREYGRTNLTGTMLISLEQKNANFITGLTRIDPDIKDEEPFQEAVNILPYDLQK